MRDRAVQRGDVLVNKSGVGEEHMHAIGTILETHTAHPRTQTLVRTQGVSESWLESVRSLDRELVDETVGRLVLTGRFVTGFECGISPKLPNVTALEMRSALPGATGTTS